MKINLPGFGIEVEVYEDGSGSITHTLIDSEDSDEYRAACNGITSMILSCACAGIDIQSVAFLEAMETAWQSIADQYH